MRNLASRAGAPAALLAFLATLPSATPVLAQPEICARPSRPDIPAGERADYEALAASRAAVDTYMDRMQDYLDCLQDESTAAAAETDRVVDEWNEAVNAFEARAQQQ